MLSRDGVEESVAEVIKETAQMEDPAEILERELKGKMGDDFDLEELRKGWEKAC